MGKKRDDATNMGCAILIGLVLLFWGLASVVSAVESLIRLEPEPMEVCAEACGPGRMAAWSSIECRCGGEDQ